MVWGTKAIYSWNGLSQAGLRNSEWKGMGPGGYWWDQFTFMVRTQWPSNMNQAHEILRPVNRQCREVDWPASKQYVTQNCQRKWKCSHSLAKNNKIQYIDGLVQKRRNSIANALELCLALTHQHTVTMVFVWVPNKQRQPIMADDILICIFLTGIDKIRKFLIIGLQVEQVASRCLKQIKKKMWYSMLTCNS